MDEARRAVWIAMSDLFLDTDVRLFYVNVARVCAESPFSQQELERIFREEVAPVVSPNLLSVAGVWDAFDEEWLVNAISTRKPRMGWLDFLSMNDYHSVALLIERLRALPPEARADRMAAWNALAPLFLDRDPIRPEVLPDEAILRLDMMRSFGASMSDFAEIEATWKKWASA